LRFFRKVYMKVFTVATRGGALAIAQTEFVISTLKRIHAGVQINVSQITTTGDRDRRTALWNLKSTGFFTSQVEDALLAGEADFAVHSFKDLPTAQRDGLTIGAVFDRNFVEDCLVAGEAVGSIDELAKSAKIGTSSLRRAAQLRHLRADLEPVPVRGNVQTRIDLLDTGKVDAVMLARAGLERLGLAGKISFIFDPQVFVPAPAQGALGIQMRTDDPETNMLISSIDDANARAVTSAERKILTTMQCGCHAPVGAHAVITGEEISIRAFISSTDGANYISRQAGGPAADAESIAEKMAHDLLDAGGKQILESLEQ